LDLQRKLLDLIAKDEGPCAACGRALAGGPLLLDYSPATGQLRGLLHQSCARAIQLVEDDPQRLRALAKYLDKDHVVVFRKPKGRQTL
jgi:hypothetical protein